MARKLTGASDAERDAILQNFDEPSTTPAPKPAVHIGGILCSTVVDDDYGASLFATATSS